MGGYNRLRNSANFGSVKGQTTSWGASSATGQLVGWVGGDGGAITNCYYKSGSGDAVGYNDGNNLENNTKTYSDFFYTTDYENLLNSFSTTRYGIFNSIPIC